ncbi:MAG: AAA domain-containing protein [Bacteroidales bacterium]|nr:AAA domain-containing protein [Bacteroidales bacterium]
MSIKTEFLASEDKSNNYVIIIDEINRGQISKIFGELITLIEKDKRAGESNEIKATLPSGQVFTIPKNIYIIGTMNTADKSISVIDSALRRRFVFIEKYPDTELLKKPIYKDILTRLNEAIYKELKSKDLLIGHSYFMCDIELKDVFNNSVIPLLYEYFYDDEKKIEKVITEAIKGTDAETELEIDNNNSARIRLKVK